MVGEMARPLRIEFPGAWYHVTARGNERRAVFRSASDRRRLLELLGQCAPRFGLRIHGYVLMANHYHLIVETPQIGLSRAMQWLNGSYTVWFNRRHARSGHLFQGRFKAVLVDAEEWGAQLSRYVHLNPIRVARLGLGKAQQAERRAGLMPAAGEEEIAARRAALREFRWSSYRAYIGLERPPPWLCLDPLRSLIGGPRGKAGESYRAYVEEAIREGRAESPLEKVQAQVVLGGASLWQKAQQLAGGGRRREETGAKDLRRRDFSEVVEIVSKLKRERWEQFRDRHGDWGRDLALWLGRAHCGLKLRELGELVGGIDYSTVSVAAIRWRERSRTDQRLLKLQKRALEMLNAKM
jgi:REP element-mobilizing transposase RayT